MSTQILDGNIQIPGKLSLDPGIVTQITNTTTGVTLNAKCGLITMQAAALAAGSAFVFTNSFITATSKILAFVSNTRCLVSFGVVTVAVTAVVAGSCTLTVAGDGANASAAAPIVQFLIV